jgi:hypothetical protein
MAFVSCPGYFENLEGRPLRGGDRVRVKWPDKTVSEETVKYICEGIGYGKVEYFAICTRVRGVEAYVNIEGKGFLIERVKS